MAHPLKKGNCIIFFQEKTQVWMVITLNLLTISEPSNAGGLVQPSLRCSWPEGCYPVQRPYDDPATKSRSRQQC